MFVLELAAEALRNLARHKLRSLLTTLGIIFGVASVMSMVAVYTPSVSPPETV